MLFIFGEIRKITSKCEASFPDVFNSRRFHKPDNIQAKHKLWALGKGLSSLPWVIRQQALQMEGAVHKLIYPFNPDFLAYFWICPA